MNVDANMNMNMKSIMNKRIAKGVMNLTNDSTLDHTNKFDNLSHSYSTKTK